jgi:hypothetical protein
MSRSAIIDNDVMIKACCFSLVDDIHQVLCAAAGSVVALGSTKYIVPKQIRKNKKIVQRSEAEARFAHLAELLAFIEPTSEELELAAEVEQAAQARNLAIDSGESLALAILVKRDLSLFATGDKRAIAALAPLAFELDAVRSVGARLVCLEQLMLALVVRLGVESLRPRVCAEPAADISVSICFSCTATSMDDAKVREALGSYIRELRGVALGVLHPTDDLSLVAQENSVRSDKAGN